MFTIVEVDFCGKRRWIVVSDSGQNQTRPCSWKFALSCVCRWS